MTKKRGVGSVLATERSRENISGGGSKKAKPLASSGDRRRRQMRPWTPEQVDQLLDLGLLQFRSELTVKITPVAECEASSPGGGTPEWLVARLDEAVRALKGRRLTDTELRRRLSRVLERIARPKQAFDRRIYQVASRELCRRLNISEDSLLRDPQYRHEQILKGRDDEPRKIRHQMECFLEWVGVPPSLWADSTWCECMKLKYHDRPKSLSQCLPGALRVQLRKKAHSTENRFGSKEFTGEVIWGEIKSTCGPYDLGEARRAAAMMYFQVMAREGRPGLNRLNKSFTLEKLIETVARRHTQDQTMTPGGGHPVDSEEFLRHLMCTEGQWDHLLGRIVYFVSHLSEWSATAESLGVPEKLRESWPCPIDRNLLIETQDYRLISDAYAEALAIDRSVFSDIWRARCTLKLREYRKNRSAAVRAVFWAARLLEEIDPRVYNAYCHWIDLFQVVFDERLAPILARDDSPEEAWAYLGAFAGALSYDPLLKCVFHSEVLGGRVLLTVPAEKQGPDYLLQNRILAYAHRRIEPVFPVQKRVDEVLRDIDGLSDHVRSAVYKEPKAGVGVNDECTSRRPAIKLPKSRSRHVGEAVRQFGPYSLHSFLAPLAQAILDQESLVFTPRIVQQRCLGYVNDPEVLAIERNLMVESGLALVGK